MPDATLIRPVSLSARLSQKSSVFCARRQQGENNHDEYPGISAVEATQIFRVLRPNDVRDKGWSRENSRARARKKRKRKTLR